MSDIEFNKSKPDTVGSFVRNEVLPNFAKGATLGAAASAAGGVGLGLIPITALASAGSGTTNFSLAGILKTDDKKYRISAERDRSGMGPETEVFNLALSSTRSPALHRTFEALSSVKYTTELSGKIRKDGTVENGYLFVYEPGRESFSHRYSVPLPKSVRITDGNISMDAKGEVELAHAILTTVEVPVSLNSFKHLGDVLTYKEKKSLSAMQYMAAASTGMVGGFAGAGASVGATYAKSKLEKHPSVPVLGRAGGKRFTITDESSGKKEVINAYTSPEYFMALTQLESGTKSELAKGFQAAKHPKLSYGVTSEGFVVSEVRKDQHGGSARVSTNSPGVHTEGRRTVLQDVKGALAVMNVVIP